MQKLKRDEEDVKKFFKYAIYVPIFFTLILEIFKVFDIAEINWFWVCSPIWVWLGGAFQFMIGGMLVEIFEGGKK